MRIPELDGIRGIAILLVLVVHFARVPGLPEPLRSAVDFGWAGVDLFFVLSGYLITSILLRTKRNSDYFRVFYTNRILRIFPLYYTFLLGFSLVTWSSSWRLLFYWLYLGNFLTATGQSIPVINHLWSLAIEEQFYLIWPLVVWKISTRGLIRICAGMIGAIVLVRAVVVHYHTPAWEFVYTFTPLRCDALLFGALVACLQERGILSELSSAIKWSAGAGFAALCLGIFRAHGTGYAAPAIERFGYFGLDLLCASLIAAVALWRNSVWFAPARSRILIFFGKYSYGLYVLHVPISGHLLTIHWIEQPVLNAFLMLVVGTAISIAAALVSWNLLEKHCLALKERLHTRRALAAVGGN